MKITFNNYPQLYKFLRAHPSLLEFLLIARRFVYRLLFSVPHIFLKRNYLKKTKVKKLHLGSGFNTFPDWLNTDLNPWSDILYLDFSKSFPFPNNTFDYVFNEHTIEHVPYQTAMEMIKKSYKVLKPGGKLRISTPNLKALINMYQTPNTKLHQDYTEWMANSFLPDIKNVTITHVLNNYFRDWGHQFIFDEETLTKVFKDAGFINIQLFKPGKSNDQNLINIESHHKMIGKKFNDLESLVLEGTKPDEK